jgi:signal peptidase II
MARPLAASLLLVLVLALVGCDHATKIVAREALGAGPAVALVPGVLELSYVENHDTAFSLTRGLAPRIKTPLLALGSILGLGAVAAFAWRARRQSSKAEQVALSLVAAGAIGNVADRLHRGYVIDFIHVRYWPVFNVADVLIVVGVILLVTHRYFRWTTRLTPSSPT